jgi:outer membrane protein TolC
MEEAYKMGFSGGLVQGKLVKALLEQNDHINKIFSGQFKTLKEGDSIVQCESHFAIIKNFFPFLFFSVFLVHPFCIPVNTVAQEVAEIYTLKQTIENALRANIELKVSKDGTQAALSAKKSQRTQFYPTFNLAYQYQRFDEETESEIVGLARALNQYNLSATVTQPLFTGFSLHHQYKIASLGLDTAKIYEKLTRQNIIFEARKTYFSLLKAQKLLKVSQEAVVNLEAQREVAENFYKVGMTPLNDLLKVEVSLANTRQNLITAKNDLEIAKSDFNTLLRRPISAEVMVQDILDYSPFENDLDYCLSVAEENRLEIRIADKAIEVSKNEVALGKKDYYPSVNIEGTYFRLGDEWDVSGGEGIGDPNGWKVAAVASWNFWEWGRTSYNVKEKMSRLSQAKYQKEEVRDNIRLEVKQAYLKNKESEKNIITIQKAIEQAKENFRINEERYKGQMATSTDVLDAQVLLSITMTNYYNALYDFKISKAFLYRAMGQEVME